jgi:gamma-glutamyltranspeptidase/glutathione hydrolase
MEGRLTRREMLRMASLGFASLGADRPALAGPSAANWRASRGGCVAGHPEAARAGMENLAAGGNAVDAVVAAALVAGVVAVPMCGIGGYGGHLMIAPTGRDCNAVAIDFNSAAPRAARRDMFRLDADGQVLGRVNVHGWLAAGVPGTLAGLQMALDRHGTLPFSQVVGPAIRFARDGFQVNAALATATRLARARLARDPGSARLLLPQGAPLRPGSRFCNPDLAALLETLAERNSVESFYRGDIAVRITEAFQRHGGLVTAEDLAAYRAREVEPLSLSWRGFDIRTAPLTAGGATVIEALGVLRELGWENRDPTDPRTTQLRVEALRAAWDDRLQFLGDPQHAEVPLRRLLSADHARQIGARAEEAVRLGRPLRAATDGRTAGGTIHLSAADDNGCLVALTLTHGESFGASVAVDGLGLILGHGMSRFDPHPDHPNAPGPGKRPLHNMCPTIVYRDGHAVLAVGGRGGRRIPNAVFDVLTAYVGRGDAAAKAVAGPRMHTEGDLRLVLTGNWRARDVAHLRSVGYNVQQGPSATVHGVAFDPRTGNSAAVA